MNKIFTSSITRLGPILTPHRIVLTDDLFIYKKRNKYLIGVDSTSIPYERISSIEIDKDIWGAAIVITTFGGEEIIAKKFSWKDANAIKEIIETKI